MLFLRDYAGFTGGHLKYCDYLAHVADSDHFKPLLHITHRSNEDELKTLLPPNIERVGLPHPCDAIFIAGVDWKILDDNGQDTQNIPVINFIQHVRHADPSLPLFKFLKRPAMRICVSQQVADAIKATGEVNGPVYVVENGIDPNEMNKYRTPEKNGKCLVAGLKDPKLAKNIGHKLEDLGIEHEVLTARMPRGDYLALIAKFEHAILLPHRTEGFYLPALEAMSLGVNVIMPDCIGARSFAIDKQTCTISTRSAKALADAVAKIISTPEHASRLRAEADKVVGNHDIKNERRKLFDILEEFINDNPNITHFNHRTSTLRNHTNHINFA